MVAFQLCLEDLASKMWENHEDDLKPFGIKTVHIFNLVTGLWLPLTQFNNRIVSILIHVYEGFLVVFLASYIVVEIYTLTTTIDFEDAFDLIAIYSVVGIIVFSSLCRSVYLLLFRKKLLALFQNIRKLCNQRQVIHHKHELINRVSKNFLKNTIFPAILLLILHLSSLIYYSSHLREEPFRLDGNATGETKSVFQKLRELGNKLEGTWMYYGWVFGMSSQFIANMKLIASDALLLGTVEVLGEQLSILESTLDLTLHHKDFLFKNFSFSIQGWIALQRKLIQLTEEANAFWSPIVVLTFTCNTVLLCLNAFTFVKTRSSSVSTIPIILLGYLVVNLMPTVIVCHAGHRFRRKGHAVSDAVRRCDWLRAPRALVPGLSLVAADCRDSFLLRGGPFFTVGLEFLVSVVGAVLTYLVVLLQFK
ncbi:Odorant receptor 32 [Ephemera danica]|nr:Odorant receptor 32 [Ephemera danica]